MNKILFYNWIDLDDNKKRGGGVSVYQRNIIEKLLENENNDVYFISSGRQYDLCNRKPYIKKVDRHVLSKCNCFCVINSPMIAPESLAFNDIELYLQDTTIYELFKEFIEIHGEFDVIHFNNLEGLTLKVLELKELFPNTKFIYSLHNYFAFCPQVNLWRCKTENCKDYLEGNTCVACMPKNLVKKKIVKNLSMSSYLEEHYSDDLKTYLINIVIDWIKYTINILMKI